MTADVFGKRVLSYSHLPRNFLEQLARVGDRIPEKQKEELLGILASSAKREIDILRKGYAVIAGTEKRMRGRAERAEHGHTLHQAARLLDQSSSLSL